MKSKYIKGKERAREEAIEWQLRFGESDHSYGELAQAANHFTRLGRRYGLLTEFRENGII